MSLGEAYRLTALLASDPGTRVFAAVNAWQHPASREWLVLAQIRDSTEYGRVGRKAEPLRRPWDAPPKRIGAGSRYSSAQMRELLDKHRAEVVSGG